MKICLIGDSLTEGRPGISFVNILTEKLPTATFDNYGKPGETIKSLHTRLTKKKLDNHYDLTFLWIGVNDIYSKLMSVQAQPIANDNEEFKEYYQKVLDIVLLSSKQVVAVSPAIVGENPMSEPNKELAELSHIIQSISSQHAKVTFLNLHSLFQKHLSEVDSSDFIGTKVSRVMLDVLIYKSTSRIDRLSQKRGLNFTLDGIHFNSKGAGIVAKEYLSMIESLIIQDK
ncbi:SGNH/GDSL hydrolase family protein [Ornithinibacillus scapharcae]|uniref:SGNH/GDSL hydrolase family protein n=1 Tax=Ornithinibacillus scapharcae TaxID=1147159 RepID=UPI000225B279|nr:SGNH/GDSL hydrolase family protein [Ornithinibacillus scapharcae]